MKKFFVLVLATGFLFIFGCMKIGSSGWDIYTTDGFSLQYPNTRTFQENVYGSTVMFFTPLITGDTIKENVGIIKQVLEKSYTIDEYYAITKQSLVSLIPGFTEISNETIQINNMDAQRLIYTGKQDNTILKWEQIYLIKDQAVYILTYTALESTFDEFVEQFEQIAASLKIN